MVRSRLGQHDVQVDRGDVAGVRDVHVVEDHACSAEAFAREVERRGDFLIEQRKKIPTRDREPYASLVRGRRQLARLRAA